MYVSSPKLCRDSAVELRIKLVFVWPRALYYSKLAFCKSTGVCEGTNDVKEICSKSNNSCEDLHRKGFVSMPSFEQLSHSLSEY